MIKEFAILAVLCVGVAGCDTADHKVETEKTFETTVAKPATVTEKTTTEVDVHDEN